MQSLVVYGRLLARAIVAGINTDFSSPFSGSSSPCQCGILPTTKQNHVHLITAACGLPKTYSPAQVTKKWAFGDDACFMAAHKLGDVIGVADGVGGWRTYGVDPSLFPSTLMTTCERIVSRGHFQPQQPVGVIAASYYELLENKAPLIGSCTACLVSLDREDKMLYTANLGDSGFRVVREGTVVHRSEEQQHYFNTPFQLAVAPSGLQGVVLSDSPESAQSTSFGVQEGDVILVGTDGLFDNLSEDMILKHIRKLKDPRPENVQHVASLIAHEAHELAFDSEYMSPFSMNAAANGLDIKGGKPDDITVLISRVTEGLPDYL
jgi:protein phosphatase PTC7